MNNETLHIIGNEFSRGIGHPFEWWEHRLNIYEHFTLASIKNQTNKNFVISMTIDNYFPPELIPRLEKMLIESGQQFIFANRYLNNFAEKMKPYLQYKYIYHTRIDSDDLFHKDIVNEIQKYEYAHRRALVFQKGYCYDCKNKRLQHYKMPSPPFATIMFPIDIYLDENKRREYMNIQGHDMVLKQMNSIILSENKFIVLVHGGNLDTWYDTRKEVGRIEIAQNEHDKILSDFGISSETFSKI